MNMIIKNIVCLTLVLFCPLEANVFHREEDVSRLKSAFEKPSKGNIVLTISVLRSQHDLISVRLTDLGEDYQVELVKMVVDKSIQNPTHITYKKPENFEKKTIKNGMSVVNFQLSKADVSSLPQKNYDEKKLILDGSYWVFDFPVGKEEYRLVRQSPSSPIALSEISKDDDENRFFKESMLLNLALSLSVLSGYELNPIY